VGRVAANRDLSRSGSYSREMAGTRRCRIEWLKRLVSVGCTGMLLLICEPLRKVIEGRTCSRPQFDSTATYDARTSLADFRRERRQLHSRHPDYPGCRADVCKVNDNSVPSRTPGRAILRNCRRSGNACPRLQRIDPSQQFPVSCVCHGPSSDRAPKLLSARGLQEHLENWHCCETPGRYPTILQPHN
jgi:hypothetical protein